MSQVQSRAALPHGYVLNGEKQSYVIEKALGQGAFGITYLARYKAQIQGQMGRGSAWVQVAVKEFFMREFNRRDEQTLSLNESSDASIVDKYRRAFMREARNLAKMHHDNIVNVFEVIEANNTAYLVMEFLDGGNLDEHIVEKGRLAEDEALGLFKPICDAVCYMHAQKVLHLDIKPKNIMLDEDGRAYLIDFGLSKQYTSSGEPESSTSIGLGTPGYAPSEQADQTDGRKDFQRTLDIYALGATLYKMLTGDTPPKATEVTASMLDGADMIKSDLRSAGVSAKVSGIVSKAMYPSRKKRYQSVEELMAAFGWAPKKYVFDAPEIQIASGQSAIGSKSDAEEETVAAGSDITVPEAKPASKPTAKPSADADGGKKPNKAKSIIAAFAGGLVLAVALLALLGKCSQDKPVPVTTGSVFVSSTPSGASIWVDDKDTGEKTPATIDSLTVGSHKLKLTMTDYEDSEKIVEIDVGSTFVCAFDLTEIQKYGSLKVTSTPSGASIWIDGKDTGRKTPDSIEDLTPGSHKIALKSSGYEDGTATVTISAGNRSDQDIQMKKKEDAASVSTSSAVISQATGSENGHGYVDLGLSVKWATCNVGANSPEDYGSYFAWGETSPKSDYSWSTLKYRTEGDAGDNVKFSKYVTDSKYGNVDNKRVLDLSDDAARANWGGSWRMPTKSEFQELIDKCTCTWTTVNGKSGSKVVSKMNGNSIFLPAAGYRHIDYLNYAGSRGFYWSSSLNSYDPYYAYELYFDSGSVGTRFDGRCDGQSVRPVSE